MSIELPETHILATQMREILPGKTVASVNTFSVEKLQKIGFMHRDLRVYDQMTGEKALNVKDRGMTAVVELSNAKNLIISLEYGGAILYHPQQEKSKEKFHLGIDFSDGSELTIRLKSMGAILAFSSSDLDKSYTYRRDFLTGLSPLEADFTFERLSDILGRTNRTMKALLVGKDAVVVGFGNAGYQEIIYTAGIHPKRKGSSLTDTEKRRLFDAITEVIRIRLNQGGKLDFTDLYGKPGRHRLFMGSDFEGKRCPRCGATIVSAPIGGGKTFFCPSCQK